MEPDEIPEGQPSDEDVAAAVEEFENLGDTEEDPE